jgi:Uncharacterized alpha/beta hydrolase domain (DUF2235)
MRHLVVCCDGTWQGVGQDSNVSRIRSAIVTPPGDPEPHYIEGVGASAQWISRLRAGLTGAGLQSGVKDGYRWLVQNYRAGDRIAVFGFSRGAYTARSIAGMIGRVGLVDGSGLEPAQLDDAVDRAYAGYRDRDRATHDQSWSAGLPFAYRPTDPVTPIAFIGVWDTVGALGIPSYVGIPDFLGSRQRYEFLDVTLNPKVPHARHAMSIDELRGAFRPTLWSEPDSDRVRQVWFAGDHTDVGGGNQGKGLSDRTLEWMMAEAAATIGLTFDTTKIPGFRPDPLGGLHTELKTGAAGSTIDVAYQPRPRAIPRIDSANPEPRVDPSVYERQRVLGYRETTTVDTAGAAVDVIVAADQGWTATGLYLVPGRYRFAAEGEWSSARQSCGPAGDTSWAHLSGNAWSRLIGAGQSVLGWALQNPEAKVPGARRVPGSPWMSLIGVVANELTGPTGDVTPDESIMIGAIAEFDVTRPGYLYAFANDAWGFYANNQGKVQLTVTRL